MSDTLQPDVIVKNGLVVEGSGVGRFDIAVADGKISAREIDIQGGSSTRVIDAKGMWVLPGIHRGRVRRGHDHDPFRVRLSGDGA